MLCFVVRLLCATPASAVSVLWQRYEGMTECVTDGVVVHLAITDSPMRRRYTLDVGRDVRTA